MTLEQEILDQLKSQTRIITLCNAERLQTEIAKYASTDDRKRIWALVDGSNNTQYIASKLGLTNRAVDIFLKLLESAKLVERQYGKPPKKTIDFTPAQWLELLPEDTSTEIVSLPVNQSNSKTS